MARRSRNQVTKQLAIDIKKKLKAQNISDKGDEHDEYGVFHDDVLVASFGIRRGSRKGEGQDHILDDLNVGPRFAKELAWCPKSRDDYLRQIGVLPEEVAGEP